MSEFEGGYKREQQAEHTISIKFGEKHIRVQNRLPIEDYISRVQRSTGEINVVEAEEYPEMLSHQKDSVVAIFTDGDISSEKEAYSLGRVENDNGAHHSYLAWVTTSFNRSKNAFEDKPFTYHLVTRDHTREDVTALVEKTGRRLDII